MSKAFYDRVTEHSRVKAEIVASYLSAWSNVIVAHRKAEGHLDQRLAYIDLFAGPGQYHDGTQSTPILILRRAIDRLDLRERLLTLFNDANPEYARSLEQAVQATPGVDSLRYKPRVLNVTVDHSMAAQLAEMKLVPTLLFVDPWGYKGLSLDLLGSVMKDWGCDGVFFFNYRRINAALQNPTFDEHVAGIFGAEAAQRLRHDTQGLPPDERERTIMERLDLSLQDRGMRYVLPFRFRNEAGMRTTHHLVFVTKHVRGYEIMKEIMAKRSTTEDQGVPSFEYNPAARRSPPLFRLSRPLDDLAGMLLDAFAGQTLTMDQVYQQHHVGTPFLRKNYKKVLRQLEAQGAVVADPPAETRRPNTFADRVSVTFPPRESDDG